MPDKQLLHYEVGEHLGAGGMGDVYLARDTKLGRNVAIKVLPEIFARDADRIARFEREAKVLASLNHPHIAGLYGLEQAAGKQFLIMELVDGETLAERIRKGRIPIEETLRMALQIAEALESAHERGIIHRDLKPANIKITSDGNIKVLDFGLAKALEGPAPSSNLSNSPTMSLAATGAGVILGTAAYMAPEQAKGKAVDHRADIFSFGCVLYEMLTGRQTFEGETATEVIASVLKQDADLSLLPPNLHPRVVDLLRRCLAKDLKRRWHAVADVRVEVETILAESRGVQTAALSARGPLWKRAIPMAAAVLVASALTAAVVWNLRPSPQPSVARFSYVLPADQGLTRIGRHGIAISPDGENVTYVANNQLYIRSMSDLEAHPLQGTAQDINTPFFSPDGQWVGFYVVPERKFKKVAITGGAAVTICEAGNPYGASWVSDDHILFGMGESGILRVPADGGQPETIIAAQPGEFMLNPQLLPDGEHVLFSVAAAGGGAWDEAQIIAQSLKSGERTVLFRGGADARYVPTGHLVYALGSTILALPFDAARLQVTGGPVPLHEDVMRAASGSPDTGAANFAISAAGVIAYIAAGTDAETKTLALTTPDGQYRVLKAPPGNYMSPRISPDGRHLAVQTITDSQYVIWIYDLSETAALRRLTFEGSDDSPVWTPDSRSIIFRSRRVQHLALFRQQADGNSPAEQLTEGDEAGDPFPTAVSPDGKILLFSDRGDIWMLPLEGEREPKPLITGAGNQRRPAFSPDGKWIAYASVESGLEQIYVQPFPPTGSKYQVTTAGGAGNGSPKWSPSGDRIYYFRFVGEGSDELHSIDIRTEPGFSFSNDIALPIKGLQRGGTQYDISPDGTQFIVMLSPGAGDSGDRPQTRIHITLNWFEELKRRVP